MGNVGLARMCCSSTSLGRLASAQIANDDAGDEKREADGRKEKDQVARVDHPFLEAQKMGVKAEARHAFHQPSGRPTP